MYRKSAIWLNWFSTLAPASELVEASLARLALKEPTKAGSNVPKARMMLFLGVSSDSFWMAMSVLLAITSSR